MGAKTSEVPGRPSPRMPRVRASVRTESESDDFAELPELSASDIKKPFRLALASICERSEDARARTEVLWRDGGNELLLYLDKVRVEFGEQLLVAVLPVYTDQSGESEVLVPFVTRPADDAFGLMAATECVPRGPHEVVDAFGDALVALAWAAVVKTIDAWSDAAESAAKQQGLRPTGLAVTKGKLRITAHRSEANGEP